MSKIELARRISDASNGILKPGNGKHGEIRLHPVVQNNVLTKENIVDIFNSLNLSINKVIPPGQTGSCSKKFLTYQLNETTYKIVVGGTGNAGNAFEKHFAAELKTNKQMLDQLEIAHWKNNLEINHRGHVGRRKFSIIPENIGSLVADISLTNTKTKERKYLSLKFGSAFTIANFGMNNLFTTKLKPTKDSIKVFEIFGIDIWNIVEGISSYKTHNRFSGLPLSVVHPSAIINPSLYDILLSSVGFGYYIIECADKNSDSLKLIKNTNIDEAKEFIGNKITELGVKYPYWMGVDHNKKSKQITVQVKTDIGKMFYFEFRNSKGDLIPNELKVRHLL